MENNKINIAEILKDCPRGMELDCTMYDNVYFDRIVKENGFYNIECYTLYNDIKNLINFSSFGTVSVHQNAECVIFPKGKTTWEGFEPPCEFKDGDIVYFMCNCGDEYIAIFKKMGNKYLHTYIDFNCGSFTGISEYSFKIEYIKEVRLATEEEKRKFFDVIKENGYYWNAETKTLDILIEPKFKVGDKIIHKDCKNEINLINAILDNEYNLFGGGRILFKDQDNWELVFDEIKPKFKVGDRVVRKDGIGPIPMVITEIGDGFYQYSNDENSIIGVFRIKDQDDYELVSNKFDITTLKPFESRVLVRNFKDDIWKPAIWGCYTDNGTLYHYATVGGCIYIYLIPYEGNEHLLGKNKDCDEYYKIWKE